MKTIVSLISALTVWALAMSPAKAATYTAAGNGFADGSATADGGYISSVGINNTASTISFTINSSVAQASYIYYAIELQIVGGPVGYTGFANPFGTSIGISSGVNSIIDTYGTGATPAIYNGSNWVSGSGVSYAGGGTGSTFATITLTLSSLGLSAGQSFYFDAVSSYTNPGGQAAYMALDSTSQPAESDNSYKPYLGTNHYDSATDTGGTIFGTLATEYTVTAVPEPTTCALMGLGSLFMIRRVVRRGIK